MTLLDMQRVFSRILTDRDFHLAFAAGDESVCAPYDLTERELRSLRGLRWDRVTAHAHLLTHGRLDMGFMALPLTQRLVQDQMHAVLDRFCREFPPVPQAANTPLVEGTRLCEFIGRLVATGELRPAYVADVAEYERNAMVLSTSPEAADSAAAVAASNEWIGGWAGELTESVPFAGPHVRVAAFRYPLVELLPLLDKGETPTDVYPAERPLLILFHKVPGIHQVQTIKINSASAELLELCDGERTCREIVDLMIARLGPNAGTGALMALDRLLATGVLGMRKGSSVCAA
jgi:hypothetical protein